MTFKSSVKVLALATAAIATLAVGASAHAAGFYIQEQSTSGLGRAFAGSAAFGNDASVIFYNPALMTELDRAQITAGASVLFPKSELTDTGTTVTGPGPTTTPIGSAIATGVFGLDPTSGDGGNPYEPTPVPSLYAATPLDFWGMPETWVGLGVSAPFGLANEYDDDYFARFDGTKTELLVLNVAPSVAFKPTPWLSIGAGVDIQYADATLEYAQFIGAEEATSKLEGDDWSVGYNLGFMVTPVEGTNFGLHYRSAISQELEGDLSLIGDETGTVLLDTPGSADLDLPDIATFSASHRIAPKTTVMGSVAWFGWSNFEEIDPETGNPLTDPDPVAQEYEDTFAFSIGVEHELTDTWTVRAGYQFDQTPTEDGFRTTRTPDGDRNWFSGGASYKWSENLTLDLAATYISIEDQEIDLVRDVTPTGTITSNINADTEGSVGILAVGLSYKF